ncbi:hypothetical protein [Alicyclobacillus fructus]|uniref:hypothetical protein n=1 Tax=Alicyclobacillus fructus TaxID=2816082 RepID=UPI001A8F15FA|nr:hypothetical protein [Alicyclobacillus fructus]
MKRGWVIACAAIGFTLVAGCGTPQRASDSGDPQAHSLVQNHSSVDPKLYAVCNAIYNGVERALAANRNESFDTQLESVEALGSSASPSSPNGQLFADAQQVVALWDAYTGEGAPAKAYSELRASLRTLQQALVRYRSG